MKRFLTLLLLVSFVSCKGNITLKKTHYGFGIDAKEVNLIPTKPALLRYKLVLKDPSEKVLVYVGYPKTKIHDMPIKKLLQDWNTLGFKKKSPHAVLLVQVPHKSGKMERLSVVMKLSDPIWNVKKSELVFEVTTLAKPNHWLVGRPISLGHLMIETSLRRSSDALLK